MLALKVAVAIAVIRGKPEGTSSLEYAESLQRKFILKQSQLENDYAEARLKISKLEKQIAKSDTCNGETDNIGNDDSVMHSLTPPPSDNAQNKAHFDTDETCNNQVELMALEIENSKFIQSVVSLENLASSYQGFNDGDVIKTVSENISILSDVLDRNVIAPPESNLCKASEAVANLLCHHPWLEDVDHVMEKVCRLIETVLSKIKRPSNPYQFPPHRQKRSLMQMLVSFIRSSSPHLSIIILDSLMDVWEEFCQDLRSSRETGTPIHPLAIESSFFIIRTLELTVKFWSNQCNVNLKSLHSLQDRLEKSLLNVVDFFPLVAHAVWKVTAGMEQILQGHCTTF